MNSRKERCTSECVEMKANNDVCQALKNVLEPVIRDKYSYEIFLDEELLGDEYLEGDYPEGAGIEIDDGEFSFYLCDVRDLNLEPLLIEFTKEHKNILIEHTIHDRESLDDCPFRKTFYKNGKSKSIEPVWPKFDKANVLPDADLVY